MIFWKSNPLIPYDAEWTVFINVSIDILRHCSKSIPEKVINDVSVNKDIIKIMIERKYLLISFNLKFVFEKSSRFINIFLGLLKESIWLRENMIKEYIFINLNPELVEKKEPPIITNIKNIKVKLDWFELSEKPILDILLDTDKRLIEKLVFKLKKRKKIVIITIK